MLDWEICTLGDPLADVGLLQVYWTGPDDEPSAWGGASTTAPGFWEPRASSSSATPRSPAATSPASTSTSPSGYWKLACILEGVYARYLGGALGARDRSELAPFAAQVDAAAAKAAEHVSRL